MDCCQSGNVFRAKIPLSLMKMEFYNNSCHEAGRLREECGECVLPRDMAACARASN